MTTHKQMKTLFVAVRQRWPELALVKPWMVVLKPVGRIIRGVMMDRTSNADRANQDWFVGCTCSASRFLPIAYGRFQPADFATSYWSHPRHQETFIELIGDEILPLLKSVETIEDLLAFRHPQDMWWRGAVEDGIIRMSLYAALGRFDVVEDEAQKIVAIDPTGQFWRKRPAYVRALDELWPLTRSGDAQAVAALLHDWARQFVDAYGLQAVYEQQPFCFESDGCA